MKKWLYNNCLDFTGLIVALVALFVSCQANNIAEHSQKKLERLECFDKAERINQQLVSSYSGALTAATRIHNYLPDKIDVTEAHTNFQSYILEAMQNAKELMRVVKRYEFKCNSEVERIINEVSSMGEMLKGTDAYEQFGGFNSKHQNNHHDNISWLFEHDVADICCSKR